mmetsp:Transcript_115022/g.332334  ORF Transcript_115022/g.332334 Transcript_115022/m.332334 type:complete len:507 (+) Transcript_115022:93-1613(+)
MRSGVFASLLIAALAMATAVAMFFVAHIVVTAGRAIQEVDPVRGQQAAAEDAFVDIVFTGEGPDLRPLVVAIRSALAVSNDPRRLRFHWFAFVSEAPGRQELLRTHLPGVHVDIHVNAEAQRRLGDLLAGSNKGLCSSIELAPLFFHEFLPSAVVRGMQRIVVLHVDVVVQGDLAEVSALDLQGHASAAMRQCNGPRLNRLVDMEILRGMALDPETCDAGDGMLVIDVKSWLEQDMSAQIEAWLDRGRSSPQRLWLRAGARLPWLLAVLKKASLTETAPPFLDLTNFWQICGGLGDWGGAPRGVASCGADAKLLHFSGDQKPWLPAPLSAAEPPLCETLRMTGSGSPFMVPCRDLWYQYMSDSALRGMADQASRGAVADDSGMVPNDGEIWLRAHAHLLAGFRKSNAPDPPHVAKPKKLPETSVPAQPVGEESRESRIAGGYFLGQEVTALIDITIRGKVAVRQGTMGIVLGASKLDPGKRINVFFKRVDKSTRSLNVMPNEITPS